VRPKCYRRCPLRLGDGDRGRTAETDTAGAPAVSAAGRGANRGV